MQRQPLIILMTIVFLVGGGIACHELIGSQAQPEPDLFGHLDAGWMRNPYWFDGKAEVLFYDASLVKYGTARETKEIVHLLVAEKHKPDLLVKADDWQQPGLVDMLKFNYIIDVQTGIYSYKQMMSIFFDQQSLHPAKMTFASHEWCGNAFKEIVNFDGLSRYEFNTYWDGQGNGRFDVVFPRDLVLYDGLPVQLRMLRWKPGLSTTLLLLPTEISSRAQPPEVGVARLRVEDPEPIAAPAGMLDAYPVVLEHAGGVDRFWFQVEFPHRMVRWRQHDGSELRLRAFEKLAYWNLNRPGDEKYLR